MTASALFYSPHTGELRLPPLKFGPTFEVGHAVEVRFARINDAPEWRPGVVIGRGEFNELRVLIGGLEWSCSPVSMRAAP